MGRERFEFDVRSYKESIVYSENVVCTYDGKYYGLDNVFFEVKCFESSGHTTRSILHIYVENLRMFLDDLENFEKTVDSSDARTFNFQGVGADDYEQFRQGDELLDCSVCGSMVLAEDAFFSVPGYMDNATDKEFIESGQQEIMHEECVSSFVDIMKDALDDMNIVKDCL